MSNGFARRKEHSKEQIRTAARTLFSRFGVEKVSITEIAEEAGVSQGTIYNHFDGKEALVRDFIKAIIEQMVIRIEETLAPEKTFWEKIRDMFQTISIMMAHGPGMDSTGPIFSLNDDLLKDPEIRKIREAAQEKMTSLLLNMIHEGKAQGQISLDISDDALRVYLSAFIHIFPSAEFQKLYHESPDIISELGRLMIYGLHVDHPGQ
jgi:AcrR family transcriptional regulator